MNRVAAMLIVTFLVFVPSLADQTADALVRKDRQFIQGTWKITALESDGKKHSKEELAELRVTNEANGDWILFDGDREIARGTSLIDPSKSPKTVDLQLTTGDSKGDILLGIYELGDNTRKLCFSNVNAKRPIEFSSREGAQQFLVVFERAKPK